MSVRRDTSGDEMAKAIAESSATPEGRAATAIGDLWEALPRIRGTIEKLLRIANLHDKGRLQWREREMTRDAQQAAITTLAHLSNIETRAAPITTSGAAAQAATRPGASAGVQNDGEQKGHSPSPHMSAGK